MALRDIILSCQIQQSTSLAKLAELAIATPTENAAKNLILNSSDDPTVTANLANDPVVSIESYQPNTPSDTAISAILATEFFDLLYNFLKTKYNWSDQDYQVSLEDLSREPENTINMLEGLFYSWIDGTPGVVTTKEWCRPFPLLKGLSIDQSRIANVKLLIRAVNDDRILCVECSHLIALNGSWRCGNWMNSGLATNSSAAGLPWEIIIKFQRCDGFSNNQV